MKRVSLLLTLLFGLFIYFRQGLSLDASSPVEAMQEVLHLQEEMETLEEEIGKAMKILSPETEFLLPILKEVKDGTEMAKQLSFDVLSHLEQASLQTPTAKKYALLESNSENHTQDMRRLAAASKNAKPKSKRSRSSHSRRFDQQDDLPPFMHENSKRHGSGSIHSAIQNGDLSFFKGHFERFHSETAHNSSGFFSRQAGRKLNRVPKSKELQCRELVKCAKRYTIYDLLTYLYIDDIDSSTGEIDELTALEQFDDMEILTKHEDIKKYVNALTNDDDEYSFDDATCDNLLAQFHRFAEDDESAIVAQWVQGSVNSVCRSTQKFTYVKIEDIVNRFQTSSGNSMIASPILQELIVCANDLHEKRPPDYTHEGFLFEAFLLPSGIKERTDPHGELPHGGKSFGGANIPFPSGMFDLVPNPAAPKVTYVYPTFNCAIEGTTTPLKCLDGKAVDIYYSKRWLKGDSLDPLTNTATGDGSDKGARSFGYNVIVPGCGSLANAKLSYPNGGWNGCGPGAACSDVGNTCDAYKVKSVPDVVASDDMGEALQLGMELAFGKTPLGEVCAVSRAVANDNSGDGMPGYCCLDTPMTSEFWGTSVSTFQAPLSSLLLR
jgi:hypothetical protein